MAVLEERRRDGETLTAAEEDELETFGREYPDCSAKVIEGRATLFKRIRLDNPTNSG
jgi:hypothetical protein